MSHHITEVPITFFLFPADLVFHPLRKSWSFFYFLINFPVSHLEKAAHIPVISPCNTKKSDENVAKSQWEETMREPTVCTKRISCWAAAEVEAR